MKLGLSFGSKTDNLIIPPSPVKEKPAAAAANGDFTLKSQSPSTFRDFGSKDETFFDSRAWLDSDCEDDFFSVNGAKQFLVEYTFSLSMIVVPTIMINIYADFTPSRGNTPVHHNFSMGTPRVVKAAAGEGSPGSASETSPTGKKKKLVELFRESIREDQGGDEQNASNNQDIANGKKEVKPTIQDILPPKSAEGTPYISGSNSLCSSERTANGDHSIFKEKPFRSVQCCLPSLVSCSSFSERKKKMNPAIAVNDKA
ncbi:hypothetical protein COLO4_17171 [Corchorus olitorius]|uniref:Uncharacterized protein n=1 Tax=Corchorus olitorius TaxID=93759 RepID=A0A1R3JDR4_9ROSI|nr:hypothetical protein COLO4_17171 [Corchorus olitorius]